MRRGRAISAAIVAGRADEIEEIREGMPAMNPAMTVTRISFSQVRPKMLLFMERRARSLIIDAGIMVAPFSIGSTE